MGIGILMVRLVVGLTIAAHGAQKLFGWYGGPGLEKAAPIFEQLGFVPGRRHALLAGIAEAVGGLLLALGLATPAAAAVVFSVMVVAGVSAHLKQGFFAQNHGYEYTLVLGLTGLSVAFTGPGPFSVDALMGLSFAGPGWGLAAFVVGLVVAFLELAGRKVPESQPAA
jgi:putative oxidoreductase